MDGIASTLGTRMTTKGESFPFYILPYPLLVLLAFRMIRPSLETSAQQQQQIQIKWNCRRLLEHIYDDYAKTLSPEEWECLPPRSHIMEIDTFKQFKDASPFDKRDIHPGYVATFFPSFIEGVQRRQRTRIIELFSNIESKEVKIVVTEDLSELAALVVSCKRHSSNRLLIGWKNVFRHLMRGWNDCTDCKVEPAAIVDAAMVISAAGMDPSKTTASEMDDLDGRFICGNCTPASYRGRQSCEVYTWVECVRHFPMNYLGVVSVAQNSFRFSTLKTRRSEVTQRIRHQDGFVLPQQHHDSFERMNHRIRHMTVVYGVAITVRSTTNIRPLGWMLSNM